MDRAIVKLNSKKDGENFEIQIANDLPFTLIAGPCQIESLDHTLFMVENLIKITSSLKIPFIFKSSFDKANRTSLYGKRGVGLEKSLEIFAKVKQEFGCPILTDVHNEAQCALIADYVDVIQIPALLCRQTDLLGSAAKTGKVINVKKGQFLSPLDVKPIIEKLAGFEASGILITERGTSFGYNNLVSDMRSIKIIAEEKVPVVFDATHSVQLPGGMGGQSGGQRQFVEVLARAAIAVGVAAIFAEVHQDPDNAPSDGPCMLRLENLEDILKNLKRYDEVTKSISYTGSASS